MPRVALDVDGILANFYLSICKKYAKPYQSVNQFHIEWFTKKMFNRLSHDAWFWANLEILNPPESIGFDFNCYMTSIPPAMIESRKWWLKSNGFPKKPIVTSDNKHIDCLKLGIDILIDDKVETLINCAKHGIKCIQFIPVYSKQPIVCEHYTRHLYDVKNIIDEFKEKV